ncbi:NAC domain-containing protein 75-like [Aegilops tauschii subsp. strangulata]|uniref:NAC domain-containing protein 75-like n=1 Tax=Aegilops tauschii subsp. strangulata TaxID=200361 RepID=UPI001ABCDE61|nr:NAC domain-containing protein 75-like [Aegilops tauschii subsp. strangulata]
MSDELLELLYFIASQKEDAEKIDLDKDALQASQMKEGTSKAAPMSIHPVALINRCKSKKDWSVLLAGVTFDPMDQELIEHLEAKLSADSARYHPLINFFIPTIDSEHGICYTHPEKLPGITLSGLSKHFFQRNSRAFKRGKRTRPKIQSECGMHVMWQKTGNTLPVMVNGRQTGSKKVLVLHTNKNFHQQRTNWVMHLYHLGDLEQEKERDLVLCKIFYQTNTRAGTKHIIS